MADQQALDAYRAQIKQDTHDMIVEVLRAPEFNVGQTVPSVRDAVLGLLRSDEFKLDADRRAQDVFREVTNVLHSGEFNHGVRLSSIEAKLDSVLATLDKPAV